MTTYFLLEIRPTTPLSKPALADDLLGEARRMSGSPDVAVHFDDQRIREVMSTANGATAPTYSASPTTPESIIAAAIEAARTLLAEQSEPDAQSEQYEHDLAAYERLVSLLATATTHDPSITALSRAALTAGLF